MMNEPEEPVEISRPIPIKEFAAQSPENAALVAQFFADLESGKVCLS